MDKGYLVLITLTDTYYTKKLPTEEQLASMGDIVIIRLSDLKKTDTAQGVDINDEAYWEPMLKLVL